MQTEPDFTTERDKDAPSILQVPAGAARRIYPWDFRSLLSCPRDHNRSMPVGAFRRSSLPHSTGQISNPAHLPHAGSREQTRSCEHPRACEWAGGRASTPQAHLPRTHLTPSPPPGLSSFPFLLCSNCSSRSRNREPPCWVPGMKSRAAVAEKTTQQAGWYIVGLRCLGCCYRGCLPLWWIPSRFKSNVCKGRERAEERGSQRERARDGNRQAASLIFFLAHTHNWWESSAPICTGLRADLLQGTHWLHSPERHPRLSYWGGLTPGE